MDADGSKSGDDSIPLSFSETRFGCLRLWRMHRRHCLTRAHLFDHFPDYLPRR